MSGFRMEVEFSLDKSWDIVQKALEGMQPDVVKVIERGALRDAAKAMASDAKAKAPVETGTLKSKIKVRATRKRKRGSVAISVESRSDNFNVVHQEYGTSRQEARAYMRPAFDQNVSRTIELVRKGVLDRVEKVMRG